ncbi:DUF2793 domain-containing protein [Sphingomonas sp.]|uniref:DUF2793 domain-containing protein n=1 Tax=Sphingomonas sp. TaxID=28214 RepID=UPI001B11CD21|nr:DUF2793 domain-containing protein [Sphingomonas sp.]MBO9712970.1 DUF2793 domain-containing protein [Sphingomonas sp.]
MTGSSTDRLALPLLEPGQAQKEMFHNEALVRLDAAVQACAVAGGLDAPPADPAAGQCWIVGASPSGAWSGHAGALACWTLSGWRFVAAAEGMRAWIADPAGFALHSGGEWRFGEAHGRLIVEGVQVVGPQAAAIGNPSGGSVVDAEARSTIAQILAAMREHGLVDPG